MDTNDLIEGFVARRFSLDDLRQWRDGSQAEFTRPEPPQQPVSESVLKQFIDASSDWQIRAGELNRTLSSWIERARRCDNSDEQFCIYQAVSEIGLVMGEAAVAGSSYLAGRMLQK